MTTHSTSEHSPTLPAGIRLGRTALRSRRADNGVSVTETDVGIAVEDSDGIEVRFRVEA